MLGLIVVHQDTVYASHPLTDDVVEFQYQPDTFAEFLKRTPDSMVVGTHIAVKMKAVAEHFDGQRTIFQIAGAPVRHPDHGRDWSAIMPPEYLDQFRPDWNKPVSMYQHGIYIKYVGFKTRSHARYEPKHYPVDPYLFTRDTGAERFRRMSVADMVEWARALYDFIVREDLTPAPSYYKLSAQLLRKYFNMGHSETLNERTRTALPGNYYLYFADPRQLYECVWEFDQSNAHHHSAEDTLFPLKSAVRQLENVPITKDVEARYFKDFAGLYRVLARVPRNADPLNVPPFNEPGEHVAWLFSNEIADVQECGVKLMHIFEAWISDVYDPLPPHYGEWCIEQIAGAVPHVRSWLKPTLLATYGMLGAKAFRTIGVWLNSETGHEEKWHIGCDKWMPLKHKENGTTVPARYTNIIHRGLIEAETRLRTLRTARKLQEDGLEVLAVYADGVYCNARRNEQAPLLSHHWRVNEIHNAHFPHRGMVVCDEYEKLPGVAGGLRKTYAAQVRGMEAPRV